MSNLSPSNSIQPLSVGDVVSAGVRIYRSNLKRYLILVLRSYLWIFVPIYGWAKSAEISARICRLAYQELINQPETLTEAEQKTTPRLWNFFAAGLLLGLVYTGLYMAFLVAFAILAVLTGVLATVNPVLGIIGGLLIAVLVIAAIFTLIRVISRLLIYEVPLAVEDQVDATTAFSRSWNLTKGSVGRIQWIVVVAFLLTLIVNIPSQILGVALPSGEDSDPGVAAIAILLFLVVSLVSSALVTPFWQVIKAVIYYDLRSRREGLGLELRDRG
ncbi:MAG: glycerophosphoryl diester phosphodiesterase membrane domain-containing protein [Plectolyngbya sp. WJT66-NPBG17]|jgi:membrane-anchored glycerophosphoryl diester phosphodiesterase (GDPDase)|nr:glycerophosphoryl diester phosphodiesterase membrane domain-containing protein [Plectolyngbya sp. WJT66-NPBG17]MBW4525676.1 glycerophosphoryl diester phosphodiesterase membrane domain-containing protein [Phormidium tanganyikae FI6-MK23]